MYDGFHAERREITQFARSDQLDDDKISMIRKVLRDQSYEKLKYANKPLPALPKGATTNSTVDIKQLEQNFNAKGLYLLGGNAPIEIIDDGKRVRVGQEKLPPGPV